MTSRMGVAMALVPVAFVAGFAFAQTMTQTGREPLFENAEVKVWKSLVLPNNPLPLHRHEHPRVLVALKGGTKKILEESGESETHKWETGKAYWLPGECAGYTASGCECGGGADRGGGGRVGEGELRDV